MEKYTLEDFNRYGVLRTPFALRLIIAVLMRQTIVALVVVLSRGRSKYGMGASGGGLDWGGASYWPLLLELPVILVIGLMMMRTPQAKQDSWARKLWPWGLHMLRLTALAQLGVLGYLAWQAGFSTQAPIMLFLLFVNACAIPYLFGYAYLQDYFRDFPPPEKPEDDKKADELEAKK